MEGEGSALKRPRTSVSQGETQDGGGKDELAAVAGLRRERQLGEEGIPTEAGAVPFEGSAIKLNVGWIPSQT
jgi:hypothetical protein|eukprot:CAMPEP_0181366674 /NCGR_PEP_ID=MMETSP1106-20121128/10848_1 /TAXON_ID=81844 /ORGANISM="Mantoniella antarctica, Strain SL-175" /LENGTH=71 /DNA_ID=CAMNT_0023482075 /DNA_START=84 /DNA_END=299 /DNA_ORIENTATION=+